MNEHTTSNITQSTSTYQQTACPAPLWRRLASMCYDSLLLLAVLVFATSIAVSLHHGLAFQSNHFIFRIYLFIIIAAFYVGFWRYGGQTLGMRAWKLKVCTIENKPLLFKQALLRFLLAVPSILLAGIGVWWALFDKQRVTLYERLSLTKTIFSQKNSF